MKIFLTGASGFLGDSLRNFLLMDEANNIVPLVRKKDDSRGVYWDYEKREIEKESLEGADVFVHLAGENISGRWTAEKKRRIRDSRIKGTKFLCEVLAELSSPPKVMLCASGVGIYGDRGDEELTEDSKTGEGFLADLGREWESASSVLSDNGVRVAHLRSGLVLSKKGGALKRMLLPFKLGFGGVLGSGKNYWSWISLLDWLRACEECIKNEKFSGPVNFVSPHAVTNNEFTKTLGKVLKRPTFMRVPVFVLRLLFGEMAEEALLASSRVVPKKLMDNGFRFSHPKLFEFLKQELS